MVDTIRSHMPNKYKSRSLKCPSCAPNYLSNPASSDHPDAPNDSVNHLISDCPAFSDLRIAHDLQTDQGLVNYFKAVTERRIQSGDD